MFNKMPDEVLAFMKYADVLYLNQNDLGRSFTYHGVIYTIIGATNPQCKYPILTTDKNGRLCRFSQDTIHDIIHGHQKP